MNFFNRLFPKTASNEYRGHRLALWGFAAFTTMTVARSLVHIFKSDGGAQSIATIPLDAYSPAAAATVVSLFAFWGLAQLLLGLIYVVVLFRYRSLISLMLLSLFCEWALRFSIGAYKPIETLGQAPGSLGAYVLPLVILVLFALSLRRTN